MKVESIECAASFLSLAASIISLQSFFKPD